MNAPDFAVWMHQEQAAVEAALQAWVPADAPAGLGVAMRYGVLDGGKRLRPLLVMAASMGHSLLNGKSNTRTTRQTPLCSYNRFGMSAVS